MFRLILLGALLILHPSLWADTKVYEYKGTSGETVFSDTPTKQNTSEKVINLPGESPAEQQQGKVQYEETMDKTPSQANLATQAPMPLENVPQTFDQADWPDDYGTTYIGGGDGADGLDRYHYYHPYDQRTNNQGTPNRFIYNSDNLDNNYSHTERDARSMATSTPRAVNSERAAAAGRTR